MNTVRYLAVLIFAMLLTPGCLSLEDIEPEVIKGCTDEVALNFDENANSNDGTCEYEPEETFEGCTSPSAVNFDPEALINDGSCIFKASAPEIDSALRDISEALGAYRNGDEMDYPILASNQIISLEIFSDINGASMISRNHEGELIYTAMESEGVATVCSAEEDCYQYRNHADSTDHIMNIMASNEEVWPMAIMLTKETWNSLIWDLSYLEIPAGTEWNVEIDPSMTFQTATAQLPDVENSLTATFSMGSVSLISLSLDLAGNQFELSLSEVPLGTVLEADNPTNMPVMIEWSDPVIENIGPVYIWGNCFINMVDLDSLSNDDVDSVNDAMYDPDMDYPDFCGEPVANDPENGTSSSTGPIFDTRWGMLTYIYDPQAEDYKEVVAEVDNRPTSVVYYLLDVTADECSENEGTYDPITQTCEWMTQEGNITASDLYFCQEYPDWGEFCQRYGINADGHLVLGFEVEDSSGGGDSGDSEMIWDCRDSLFAEDTTPFGPDDDEDVQAEVDAMTEPAWCGQLIEWNGSFESDPSSESAIANNNWNSPDSMYLDFTSAGALNVGDRSVTQSECSEYGGSWNAIEEACEFPNGEWIANETLVEIDFGWGMVERLRYEMLDGGIVLAFPAENGSGTGTPDMANTFYEGWEETGYHAYDFTASEDGLHIIESAQDEDGYLYLYEGDFNKGFPMTNLLASQDDWEVGSSWGSSIHWDLVAGQDYVIVTTAYSSGYEVVFENDISSPSGDIVEWGGTIDSDSPIFLRPDGYWEDDGGGSGGGDSGMMMSVSVSEDQMQEVNLDELTIEVYTDEGELIGSASMDDALTEFDWGSVAVLDNDGNGLLSAGDEVIIQSDSYASLWFDTWDDWAGDYAST